MGEWDSRIPKFEMMVDGKFKLLYVKPDEVQLADPLQPLAIAEAAEEEEELEDEGFFSSDDGDYRFED